MKPTLLWLDDMRDPFSANWSQAIRAFLREEYNIAWVKSYHEFTNEISTNGLPNMIGFDHDLADEHYRESMYNEDGHYSNYYTDGTFKEKTGYDCAKWLVEYCTANKLSLPEYFVQSANPIGIKNIISYLDNAKEHLGL